MLVLSRTKDQSIIIGDNIKITIVDVRGDKVRLGITAPKDVPVHREEIWLAIQKEKQSKQEQTQGPPAENQAQQPPEQETDQKSPAGPKSKNKPNNQDQTSRANQQPD